MKKRIYVTSATIKEAIARRAEFQTSICDRCVITIALQKAFKTKNIRTSISTARVNNNRVELSQKAINVTQVRSIAWDILKPFSFTIEI